MEAQPFQAFDTGAANSFLGGVIVQKYDPIGGEIKTNLPDTQYIANILTNFKNYQDNTAKTPQPYPSLGQTVFWGVFSDSKVINSNTFAKDLAVSSAGGQENIISFPTRNFLRGWTPIPGLDNKTPNNLFQKKGGK